MTAFEHAGRALERLLELKLVGSDGLTCATARWVITEAITDALLEQVEHARAQAPAIHIHTKDGV